MNRDNVVAFRPSLRNGMARRGAPDKTHGLPAETVEVECPHCAAVFCLEPISSMSGELLCAGCETAIPLQAEDARTGAGAPARSSEEIRLTR